MIPATNPISDEDRKILEQDLKLKPRRIEPLKDYFNPHSQTYWATNAAILAACVAGRYFATKTRGPRIFWGLTILAIPAFTLFSTIRLDRLEEKFRHRLSLEERLELSPVTRRAWERALDANKEYQSGLKSQIEQLKKEQ